MQKHLAILLFLLFEACSNSGGSAGDVAAQTKGTDVTDRSVCIGSTATNASLLNVDWKTKFKHRNGVLLERTLRLTEGRAELSTVASYNGRSERISARAGAKIIESSKTIVIQTGDKAEGTLSIGDNETFGFSIEIAPQTVQYDFIGPCLKITTVNDESIYIPGN